MTGLYKISHYLIIDKKNTPILNITYKPFFNTIIYINTAQNEEFPERIKLEFG